MLKWTDTQAWPYFRPKMGREGCSAFIDFVEGLRIHQVGFCHTETPPLRLEAAMSSAYSQ